MKNRVNVRKWLISTATLAVLSTTALPAVTTTIETVHSESNQSISMNEYIENDLEFLENNSITINENRDLILSGTIPEGYFLQAQVNGDPVNLSGEFTVTIPGFAEGELNLAILDANYSAISQNSQAISEIVEELEERNSLESVDREEEDYSDFLNEDLSTEESRDAYAAELYTSRSNDAVMNSSSSRSHENGIYTVKSGDTFNAIAEDFGMTPLQLRQWNGHISDINVLVVGERIAVTRAGVESMLSDEARANLITGGDPHHFGSAANFVSEMAPLALEVANQAGEEPLYPSLMLAQAMHESGVARQQGMSALASPPYHNMFGIKASGNQEYVTAWTWEHIQGENVDVLANFRTFPSYRGSFEGYANLLRRGRGTGEDFYYRGTWRSNTQDVWEVLEEGGLRGYATDPAYFEAIEKYINDYDLERFDRNVERLEGETRFETAVSVSQDGWNSADTVLLADGFEFADALAATPLATALNSPILLTRTNRLEESTKNEIERLDAENVIILGGENAISENVAAELEELGVNVERLAGETRYETAGLIAEQVIEQTGTTQGIIVDGFEFADAMSVAPFAAENGIPIYLTPTRDLHREVLLVTDQLNDWYIIGGANAVTGAVGSRLQGRVDGTVTRLSGDNRYATNQRVINHFGNGGDHAYVASGTDFPDALTGSVLAGREGSNLLLVNNQDRFINAQLSYSRNNGFANFTFLGGEQALPQRIEESFTVFRVVD